MTALSPFRSSSQKAAGFEAFGRRQDMPTTAMASFIGRVASPDERASSAVAGIPSFVVTPGRLFVTESPNGLPQLLPLFRPADQLGFC
ncbi:hypothetical protein SGA01_73020 [Streptomyces gardneri]|uniref:Uncharacterized protein n=1 Tax=Streptomyces gardneri TaxID=66892 RepID=A0A4Y3RY17_9ACTN|nr:hypothetical protein SGA01_73020 [Streptomyces gardneri]